jgi:hypothetical protein
VRCAGINLQLGALDDLGREQSRGADRHNLIDTEDRWPKEVHKPTHNLENSANLYNLEPAPEVVISLGCLRRSSDKHLGRKIVLGAFFDDHQQPG